MRFAIDTGGTFTDLLVEDELGAVHMFKASTTPDDPIAGVIESLRQAAAHFDLSLEAFLDRGAQLIHGTTHAINAVITGRTARTAFLTTQGHPDILVFREGSRREPFNFTVPFPDPYVPRSLTFEVPGRVAPDGSEMTPLDEAAVARIVEGLAEKAVEAVAVCLLWSIVNPSHEQRVRELVAAGLPHVALTLSHELSPTIREYRRASATAIDASLKPLMADYMGHLRERLAQAGYRGRILVVTSQGGVIEAAEAAAAPIHLINSGPSMAPVAGKHFATAVADGGNAIVADTGGTTYDISLIRDGAIPRTRETWIGEPYRGHMTGFPSVDVKSVGAGSGSIASIDSGGMLHVGPMSAGAFPGPVCYGRGGDRVTVTDAALVLGYIDPKHFLGGQMALDLAAARAAIDAQIAGPLSRSLEAAASAILQVATENMVQAIMGITVNQGIDPAESILVGGGGAAGLNSAWIGRRLGCGEVVIPAVGAALSAAGALMSDLSATYTETYFTRSDDFDVVRVNSVLDALDARCRAFGTDAQGETKEISFGFEARYPSQVWEIEVELPVRRFGGAGDLEAVLAAFHAAHKQIFSIDDPNSPVEFVAWNARARCPLRTARHFELASAGGGSSTALEARRCFFDESGWVTSPVYRLDEPERAGGIAGPAIVESSFTTVVVPPGFAARWAAESGLVIETGVRSARSA